MATTTSGSGRSSRGGSGTRRTSSGSSRQGGSRPSSSSSSRPRRARAQGGSAPRGRNGSSYQLHKNNIRFNTKGGSVRNKVERLDRRTILVMAIALVIVIVVILVISSVVSSCSRSSEEPAEVNSVDSRVAAGVDEATTNELTPVLDEADKYDKLAQQANRYPDARLIELAIREPSSLDFVLSYPDLVGAEDSTATTTATAYDGTVAQGVVPELYCWNANWGALEYNDGPMAVTGSGPCALSATIMYLTGSASMSPGTIVSLINDGGYAGGETGMMSGFITDKQDDLGIEATFYEPSIDNLSSLLSQGIPVLMDIGAGDLGSSAHWVLVWQYNDDNSVAVFDPTSAENSSHGWSIGTMANLANSFYAITAAPASTTSESASSTGETGTTSTTTETTSTTSGGTTTTTGTVTTN